MYKYVCGLLYVSLIKFKKDQKYVLQSLTHNNIDNGT